MGVDFVLIEIMFDIKEVKVVFFVYKKVKEEVKRDILCLVFFMFE